MRIYGDIWGDDPWYFFGWWGRGRPVFDFIRGLSFFFGNLGFSWMGYRCGRPWCLEDGMSCFEASAFHTLNLLILCRNGGLGEGDMN